MNKVRVSRATEAHAVELAANLRAADIQELAASSGASPLEAVTQSVAVSPDAYVALDEHGVIAAWGVGVGSLASSVGSPWLLATERMAGRYRRQLLALSRIHVARMRRQFSYLTNFVDARHAQSLRWLRWCGFVIHPPEPYGVAGLPFHRFDMKGDL